MKDAEFWAIIHREWKDHEIIALELWAREVERLKRSRR